VIYFASIRNVSGGAFGLFKSTDGGVDWKLENVAPAERGGTPMPVGQQDLYYPQIDPYNANHLIITGHESNWIAESTDGGVTWTALNEPPPSPVTGTAFMYFVNTGVAGTAGNHSSGGTANTWIWIAQGVGGGNGTWRTTNGSTSWKQVNNNEHGHGTSSMYQPYYANGSGTPGTIFMDGFYFGNGGSGSYSAGIIYSLDYGATWQWAGSNSQYGSFGQNVINGTSKNIYSNNGAALNVGSLLTASPNLGTGATWTQPSSFPNSSWTWGAGQFAVVNDGTHNILIGAMWVNGIWRYVEP
jgi:hypothetical protein